MAAGWQQHLSTFRTHSLATHVVRPAPALPRIRASCGPCLQWGQGQVRPVSVRDNSSEFRFSGQPSRGGELMQRFGEKLHALRIAHELTLQQMAAELGYATHAYISELESGKKVPTAALVLKVARRFNVSTDVLMKDELDLPQI
jgi:DNA-binding XRE family transcriptional regulator